MGKLPDSLKHLADKIEAAGCKITFGLVQQGHIPTIEKTLGSLPITSEYTWEKIGKEIGWDGKTAAFYYAEYLQSQLSSKEKEIAALKEQLRWIPITERKPDIGVPVLTFMEGGPFKKGVSTVNYRTGTGSGWTGFDGEYITRWLPIPSLNEK